MIHHIDCLEFMRGMVERGERVDCIITDPPYLYLNHKLDRKFNESEFFELASKITDRIAFFGRGDSFYKWNLLCADFGFEFKEEVIWDKRNTTSPLLPLGRCHETISIRMKKGAVKKVFVDALNTHFKAKDFFVLINDLKRALSSIKNSDALLKFLEKGEKVLSWGARKHNLTSQTGTCNSTALIGVEKYTRGTLLKSIIVENREHYKMEHPTQKPIDLLRKLVLLISDKGELVFDPFMGSGSTGVASLIEGRKFVGCEIDSEYFEIAKRRIGETDKTLRQSLFYGID